MLTGCGADSTVATAPTLRPARLITVGVGDHSAPSQFVGKVGETIDIAIDILRVNFIAKLNCWVVNARNADNLVVFFTSNGETFKDMASGTIRGRVKRHQTSNYHDGKETVLNYVKVMSNG